MAKIVVAAAAYLGDVAPYIPVAERLAARGHEVTFLAPEGYRSIMSGSGQSYRYEPYGLDFSSAGMHADPRHEKLARHPYRNALPFGRYLMAKGYTDDPDAALTSMTRAFAGADAVVTHPTFATVSLPIAQSLDIPTVVGHLFPMLVPTASWGPPMGERSPNFGRAANRAIWKGFGPLSGLLFRDRQINALRRDLGLAPIRGNASRAWTEADRTVMLVSRHYFGEAPDDWPPVSWGGFSIWSGGHPADGVEAFMRAGDPPVVVTLGTSAASGAGAAFARIADDLASRGARSLLLAGDAKNLDSLGGRPGAFAFAPLVPLLPRCPVAVVSGALGGIAASLHAGVPLVVLPQLFDQIWHGRRVQDLGLGRLVRKPADVADAVMAITADPSYAQRSREFAAKLAAEDGAGALADAAESVL